MDGELFIMIIQFKNSSHIFWYGSTLVILHLVIIIKIPYLRNTQEKQRGILQQLHKCAEEPFVHSQFKYTLSSACCCMCSRKCCSVM